jgi:hypothetical protein
VAPSFSKVSMKLVNSRQFKDSSLSSQAQTPMQMLTSGDLRNWVAAPNIFPEASPNPYVTDRIRTDRTVKRGGIY